MEQFNEPKEVLSFSTSLNEFMAGAALLVPAYLLPGALVESAMTRSAVGGSDRAPMLDKSVSDAKKLFAGAWGLALAGVACAALHGAGADTYEMIVSGIMVGGAAGYWVGRSASHGVMMTWASASLFGGAIPGGLVEVVASIFGTNYGWGWGAVLNPMLCAMATGAIIGARKKIKIQGLQIKTG